MPINMVYLTMGVRTYPGIADAPFPPKGLPHARIYWVTPPPEGRQIIKTLVLIGYGVASVLHERSFSGDATRSNQSPAALCPRIRSALNLHPTRSANWRSDLVRAPCDPTEGPSLVQRTSSHVRFSPDRKQLLYCRTKAACHDAFSTDTLEFDGTFVLHGHLII